MDGMIYPGLIAKSKQEEMNGGQDEIRWDRVLITGEDECRCLGICNPGLWASAHA